MAFRNSPSPLYKGCIRFEFRGQAGNFPGCRRGVRLAGLYGGDRGGCAIAIGADAGRRRPDPRTGRAPIGNAGAYPHMAAVAGSGIKRVYLRRSRAYAYI